MKTTVAIIAALVAAEAFAQCPTLDTAAVVAVDSVTAADLYARANKWFADAFKDANEVIQYKDAATFTVSGKGVGQMFGHGYLYYTVEIACKDGRYRYEIKDIHHGNPGAADLKWWYQDLGTLYRCETCSHAYMIHKQAHPKQSAALLRYKKLCEKEILPLATGELWSLIASLKAGMATQTAASKDW